jgi:Tfp pilus assembly protein PilX/cytoskeletal protein CcmA (bactofilin family)
MPSPHNHGMIDMRHLTNFKRHPTDEAGFVLPTAMIVLLMLTVLIGAAVTVASQTSTSTTRDSNTKAALEAAEAGLQTASYRLSKLEPEKSECVTGTAKAPPTIGIYCAGSGSEPLGNGASFEYWASKGLVAGEKCGGETVSTQENVTPRCITSVGNVNGVARRVQERAASLASPLFQVKGILGYHSVLIENNGVLEGEVGTNETLTLKNGVTVERVDLGPLGKVEGTSTPKETIKNTSPFEPPPVPIGESANSAITQAECKPPPEGGEVGPNCDFLITSGADANSGVVFTPSTRSLSMGQGASLELKEGVYNFCNFQVSGNNTKLTTVAGGKVEIFIDSALRAKSGCTAPAGKLEFKNGLELIDPNKNALYLQIYVYDGSGGTVELKNNVSGGQFYGTIVAPYSKVTIGNNAEFVGAIEANEVELAPNFKFKFEIEVNKLKTPSRLYERKAWEECPPTYIGTNFQEGC